MPDITYDVGRVSFVMKGAWNLATNYEKLDAVTHDGSLYIAKQDVPGGTAITNTTYWQLAAEKGDQGPTGGVDSVNGQQGNIWFPDSRQLISDGYTTDTAPFLTKVNDSDSDRFELAKKLGNTVAVNQLVQNGDFSNGTTNWAVFDSALASISASSGVLTETIAGGTSTDAYKYGIMQNISRLVTGHTHITIITVNPSVATTFRLELGGAGAVDTPEISTRTTLFLISDVASYNTRLLFYPRSAVNNVVAPAMTIQYENIHTHDLSLWYGNTGSIPPGLIASPENWGDYYAGSLDYNAGALESADGTVLTSFGTDGVTVLAEVDTGSEVLRSAGAVADEKTPDGTITRKVGVVDLGTLTWTYDSNRKYFSSTGIQSLAKIPSSTTIPANVRCGIFLPVGATYIYNSATSFDKSVGILGTGALCISDQSYTTAAAFKTAMSGVYLYYELATPTTEQGTAFNPIVATVKGGVLSWTNTKGIPAGHESHWFENLRKRVEDRLPDPPSGDGTYRLTCTISGGVKTYSWEA